jgi:hypothetical protein
MGDSSFLVEGWEGWERREGEMHGDYVVANLGVRIWEGEGPGVGLDALGLSNGERGNGMRREAAGGLDVQAFTW